MPLPPPLPEPPGPVPTPPTLPNCPPTLPSALHRLSTPGIYLVPLDGGLPQKFAIGDLDPVDVLAAPDGRQMLVWASDGSLYSVNDDGSGRQRLDIPFLLLREAAWSPDGRWIAWHQRAEGTTPDSVWVMAPDGSQRRMIFEFPPGGGDASPPRWSPDSTRVAVTGSGAWVIDIASGTNRRVFSDPMFTLAWSPGSDRLVADLWGPKTVQPDGTTSFPTEIVVINADGTGRHDLRNGNLGTWAPSGDIVLVSREVISDSGEERPFTFRGLARTFAPDGEHLVTEDGPTVFIYDRAWCGQPLVDVDGPYDHWFGWAGPSRVLVRVHPSN